MSTLDLQRSETFPTRRDEDWKYTDVRRFLRAEPECASPFVAPADGGPFTDFEATYVFSNGEGRYPPRVASEDEPDDTFGNQLTVPGRKGLASVPDAPLVYLVRWVSEADSGEGWQASIGFTVGPNDHVVLLESYEGQGEYVSNTHLNIAVMEGARLERIVLADDTESALSFSRADVALGAGAAFSQTVVTTGAKLQRIETRLKHPGDGATVKIDGAYLLDGARHADMTTEVDHVGGNGETDQLIKGVVRDAGRGVFQGRIIVREGSDGTDARMGHHALITSERGEVDAKPELEIYADDVSCAHGNTVGALDESALFYMQQRGLPTDVARALLTEAFLMEVVDRIGHEGARERCRDWLAERL